MKPTNEWGITPAEAAVLDALILTGDNQLAANALGLSIKTIERHLQSIRKRMKARNRIAAVLKWARWRWGVKVEEKALADQA